MTKSNIDTLKVRRANLEQNVVGIEDALDDAPPKDWEDRSSERQGDEVLEALGNQNLDEIRRIDAALARVSEGTYGICTQCGNDISDGRLSTLPETPFCKSCAQRPA
jgi:RNA polymerase-binding transcription factor DksA